MNNRAVKIAILAILLCIPALVWGQVYVPSTPQDVGLPADTVARINSKPSAIGEKFRVASQNAAAQNHWNRPYMFAVPGWQPSTAYKTRDLCVHGGRIYVAIGNGTTSTTGPAQTTSTTFTDGGVLWNYWKPNVVANGPEFTATAWAGSTAYTVGQFVSNNGLIYYCVTAGTSASSGGPTGNSVTWAATTITDGSAAWTYYGPVTQIWAQSTAYVQGAIVKTAAGNIYSCTTAGTSASSGTGPSGTGIAVTDGTVTWDYQGQYTASPYQADYPVLTTSSNGTSISGLSNIYTPQTTVGASVMTFRGGYLGNNGSGVTWLKDLQTFSPTSFTVTGDLTSGSSVLTNVSPTTNLATGTQLVVASGLSGTGKIQTISGSTVTLRSDVTATTTATGQTLTIKPLNSKYQSIEFYTDAPKFYYYVYNSESAPSLVVDNVRVMLTPGKSLSANGYQIVDFSTTSGRKVRKIRLEVPNGRAVQVGVDSSSQVWAVPDALPIRACFVSDSIIDGSSYGPFIIGNNIPQRLALELGWTDPWSFAQGGTGYINRGTNAGITTDKFSVRIAEAIGTNPDVWVLFGSTNDTGQGASTIQAAALSLLQQIRAGSSAPIIVFGVWPILSTTTITANTNSSTTLTSVSSFTNVAVGQTPTGTGIASGTTIKAFDSVAGTITLSQAATATATGVSITLPTTYITENAVKAAVTQFADSKTYFLPLTGDSPLPWLTGVQSGTANNGANTLSTNISVYLCGDNTHPVDPGTEYIALKMATAIRNQVLPNL
jgi:hypothetical protein